MSTTSDSFSFSIDESESDKEEDIISFTEKVVDEVIETTENVEFNVYVFTLYVIVCALLFIWQADKSTWEALFTFFTGYSCSVKSCIDQCPINSTVAPFSFFNRE